MSETAWAILIVAVGIICMTVMLVAYLHYDSRPRRPREVKMTSVFADKDAVAREVERQRRLNSLGRRPR